MIRDRMEGDRYPPLCRELTDQATEHEDTGSIEDLGTVNAITIAFTDIQCQSSDKKATVTASAFKKNQQLHQGPGSVRTQQIKQKNPKMLEKLQNAPPIANPKKNKTTGKHTQVLNAGKICRDTAYKFKTISFAKITSNVNKNYPSRPPDQTLPAA